jgi:hypothetical protein
MINKTQDQTKTLVSGFHRTIVNENETLQDAAQRIICTMVGLGSIVWDETYNGRLEAGEIVTVSFIDIECGWFNGSVDLQLAKLMIG